MHVGDTITYNDRQHTLGSKQARGFAVIVEFHKNVGKTGVKMELSNGYRIEDDFFKLHKHAGGLKVNQSTKSQNRCTNICYRDVTRNQDGLVKQIKQKLMKSVEKHKMKLIVKLHLL